MLTELQSEICTFLNADEWFDALSPAVTALPEDKLNLAQEVTNALAGIGVCLIVSTPKMVVGTFKNQVTVSVILSVVESPLMNRASTGTGQPAGVIAEKALAVLLNKQPVDVGWTPFQFVRMEMAGVTDQGQLLWELELQTTTQLAVSAEPPS